MEPENLFQPLSSEEENSISKYGKNHNKSSQSKKTFHFKPFIIVTLFLLFLIVVLISFFSFQTFSTFNSSVNKTYKIDSKLRSGTPELDALNEQAMHLQDLVPYPMQLLFLKRTNAALLNLFCFIRFKKSDIDLDRLIYAVNATIYNHPILSSRFYKDEKTNKIFIRKQFDPEKIPKVEIVHFKEKDLRNREVFGSHLLHNFEKFDHQMAFFKIYISEESICLFYDILHTVADGNSLLVVYESIESAYLGKPMPKDYYFLYLKEYNDMIKRNDEKWIETKKYYEENYNLLKDNHPKYDFETPKKTDKKLTIFSTEYRSKEIKQKLYKFLGDKLFDYNIYMSMYILLTNYIYSGYTDNKPEYRWGYNGRNFKKQKYSVGCLITHFPIKYEFDNTQKVKKINLQKMFESIKQQLTKGRSLERMPQIDTETAVGVFSILQRDKSFQLKNFLGKPCEEIYHYDNTLNEDSEFLLDPVVLEMVVSDEDINALINFDAKFYTKESFERYTKILKKCMNFIADNFGRNEELSIENLFY